MACFLIHTPMVLPSIHHPLTRAFVTHSPPPPRPHAHITPVLSGLFGWLHSLLGAPHSQLAHVHDCCKSCVQHTLCPHNSYSPPPTSPPPQGHAKKKDKLLTMDASEITYEMVAKKLKEIVTTRGRKGTDKHEQVGVLTYGVRHGLD